MREMQIEAMGSYHYILITAVKETQQNEAKSIIPNTGEAAEQQNFHWLKSQNSRVPL